MICNRFLINELLTFWGEGRIAGASGSGFAMPGALAVTALADGPRDPKALRRRWGLPTAEDVTSSRDTGAEPDFAPAPRSILRDQEPT